MIILSSPLYVLFVIVCRLSRCSAIRRNLLYGRLVIRQNLLGKCLPICHKNDINKKYNIFTISQLITLLQVLIQIFIFYSIFYNIHLTNKIVVLCAIVAYLTINTLLAVYTSFIISQFVRCVIVYAICNNNNHYTLYIYICHCINDYLGVFDVNIL